MASGDERWRDEAARVVTAAGFDLEDFSVVSAGRRRLVRVVVDADSGFVLDAAADLSRQLSAAYDDLDAVQGGTAPAYTLEVTSPGIGRPLTEPRHFQRARGRLVSLTRTDGRAEQVRVLGVTDDGVDVLTGPSGTTRARIALDEISKAKVDVEFAAPSAAVTALLAADPRTAPVVSRAEADADGLDSSDGEDDGDGTEATAVDTDEDPVREEDR
jgi:ribosome maturation factor RimP